MIGTIKKVNNSNGTGWIEDKYGDKIFFSRRDCKFNSVRQGLIVKFDTVDEGKPSLKAVNIDKIGLGKRHPFYKDCLEIVKYIKEYTPEDERQKYIIEHIEAIGHYFSSNPELLPYGRDPYMKA